MIRESMISRRLSLSQNPRLFGFASSLYIEFRPEERTFTRYTYGNWAPSCASPLAIREASKGTQGPREDIT